MSNWFCFFVKQTHCFLFEMILSNSILSGLELYVWLYLFCPVFGLWSAKKCKSFSYILLPIEFLPPSYTCNFVFFSYPNVGLSLLKFILLISAHFSTFWKSSSVTVLWGVCSFNYWLVPTYEDYFNVCLNNSGTRSGLILAGPLLALSFTFTEDLEKPESVSWVHHKLCAADAKKPTLS